MSFYLAAGIRKHDAEMYEQYRAASAPMAGQHGAVPLAVTGPATVWEGELDANVIVVVRFPGEQEFRRWWDSPEYAKVKPLRLESATTHFVVTFEASEPPEHLEQAWHDTARKTNEPGNHDQPTTCRFLAAVQAHDVTGFAEYRAAVATNLVEDHKFMPLAVSPKFTVEEGELSATDLAMFSFTDRAEFESWWNSERHHRIKQLRLRSADTLFAITYPGEPSGA